MSFLGMGPFEIIIVLLVAFIFLGPERMAEAARTLGKWTGEIRRMGAGARAEMDDLIAEDAPSQPDRRPAPTDANQAGTAASTEPTPADDGPVAFRGGSAAPYRHRQAASKTASQAATPRNVNDTSRNGNDRNSNARNSEESKA